MTRRFDRPALAWQVVQHGVGGDRQRSLRRPRLGPTSAIDKACLLLDHGWETAIAGLSGRCQAGKDEVDAGQVLLAVIVVAQLCRHPM